ncbi:MAG: hypothetical protein R3E86_15675 [Pseudomonadales bacterium]
MRIIYRNIREAAGSTALLALLLLAAAPAQAALRFHWVDSFSPDEQVMLSSWLDETRTALERLVGPLPFDVDLYLHRRDGAREPVPWANTRRGSRQGVNLYVDPARPLQAFRDDWTAPHELSHLVLPYLGSSNAWFAEGFASYMQFQVMHAMGVISSEEVEQRYLSRLERAEQDYAYPGVAFVAAAPRLRQERKYPVMYWGGALYFLQVDRALHELGAPGLPEQLRAYVACCRTATGGETPATLAATFDRLSGTQAFSTTLARFEAARGFPDYAWLRDPASAGEP